MAVWRVTQYGCMEPSGRLPYTVTESVAPLRLSLAGNQGLASAGTGKLPIYRTTTPPAAGPPPLATPRCRAAAAPLPAALWPPPPPLLPPAASVWASIYSTLATEGELASALHHSHPAGAPAEAKGGGDDRHIQALPRQAWKGSLSSR